MPGPLTSFSLGSVLTGLGCPHEELYLYNAGNDATYTLVAMIKLVVKGSSSMNRLLKRKEEANIERLENLVFTDATPKVDDHGNPQEEPPR